MFSVKSPVDYIQQAGLCQQAGEHIRPLTCHLRILTSPSAWQAVSLVATTTSGTTTSA